MFYCYTVEGQRTTEFIQPAGQSVLSGQLGSASTGEGTMAHGGSAGSDQRVSWTGYYGSLTLAWLKVVKILITQKIDSHLGIRS